MISKHLLFLDLWKAISSDLLSLTSQEKCSLRRAAFRLQFRRMYKNVSENDET